MLWSVCRELGLYRCAMLAGLACMLKSAVNTIVAWYQFRLRYYRCIAPAQNHSSKRVFAPHFDQLLTVALSLGETRPYRRFTLQFGTTAIEDLQSLGTPQIPPSTASAQQKQR